MPKTLWILLAIVGIATTAPIWRGAGHSRQDGVSFWTLLHDSTRTLKESPFGHPHIPYDEAVMRAQQAYRDYCGGQNGNL